MTWLPIVIGFFIFALLVKYCFSEVEREITLLDSNIHVVGGKTSELRGELLEANAKIKSLENRLSQMSESQGRLRSRVSGINQALVVAGVRARKGKKK